MLKEQNILFNYQFCLKCYLHESVKFNVLIWATINFNIALYWETILSVSQAGEMENVLMVRSHVSTQ